MPEAVIVAEAVGQTETVGTLIIGNAFTSTVKVALTVAQAFIASTV